MSIDSIDMDSASNVINPLDSQWYHRFEKFGSFQSYEYLDGDKSYRTQQKDDFINGHIENPVLDYPKIDKDKLLQDHNELSTLKNDIKSQEQNDLVKKVYIRKINEKLAEIKLLLATADGDQTNFFRFSKLVFGLPSEDVFSYSLSIMHNILDSYRSSDNPEVSGVVQDICSLLPLPTKSIDSFDLPQKDTVDSLRQHTKDDLSDLFAMSSFQDEESKDNYDAKEIVQGFSDALQAMQIDGWSVVIDKNKSNIAVSHQHKKVQVPEDRIMSKLQLQKLILHEIGTHVYRRHNGEHSRLLLLGLGLDRYTTGEEGLATAREQILDPSMKDFSGLEGHLAISLACGLDGTKRDFRQVYTILQKWFYFKNLVSGLSPEISKSKAQDSAWARCVRTFRGTDCKTPGICYTKDIAYREGNIGVWNVVKNNASEMMRFSIGKYDPSNPRHIWVLDQLAISEDDL